MLHYDCPQRQMNAQKLGSLSKKEEVETLNGEVNEKFIFASL